MSARHELMKLDAERFRKALAEIDKARFDHMDDRTRDALKMARSILGFYLYCLECE